jgi:hypothetical protein
MKKGETKYHRLSGPTAKNKPCLPSIYSSNYHPLHQAVGTGPESLTLSGFSAQSNTQSVINQRLVRPSLARALSTAQAASDEHGVLN